MKLFKRDEQLKQPAQFLERLSELLEEGYTFDEGILILSPFHTGDQNLWHEKIQQAFITGHSPQEILSALGIRKRYLLAITIASSTGDLARALKLVSREMAFQEQMVERLKKLLYYPIFLFIFIVCLFIAYRRLFLPRMESLIHNRTTVNDATSLKWTEIFLSVPDYFFYCGISFVFLFVLSIYFISKRDIKRQLSIIYSTPVIQSIFALTLTMQFARGLGNLLLHGFSLQDALRVLEEQNNNSYIAYISKQLLDEVLNGEPLSVAVSKNPFLLSKFESFIVHGEKSSMLNRELLIFADLLEEKFQSRLNNSLKILQPSLLLVIAICVLAAYLSILLPIYNMIEFV